VVDFTFQLHPVGQLLGGLLIYPLEDAPAAVAKWRELMLGAPDRLACFALIARSELTGAEGAIISVAYFGDPDDGRETIGPLLDNPAPGTNAVRPMYYPELQEIFGRMPFGLRNYWSGRFLRELPDELVAQTSEQFHELGPVGGVLFEPLHGAPRRVPSDATPFAGREANWNVTFIKVW